MHSKLLVLGTNGFVGKHVRLILEKEGIESDKKVVAELINKHFPDWRRVLNELQRYSVGGIIDTGCLLYTSPSPRD